GNQSISKFKTLDNETADAINQIVKKINKAHQKLEANSRDILIQNQKLLELQATVEAEILFNQKIINELQSIINTKDSFRSFRKNYK
ncbi:hypothetical protein, partial [Campylobacter fetus]